MPQSFCQLYGHLIFSTRQRQRLLDEAVRPRVHGCLANLVRELDSPWVVVGGTEDHVHLLMNLSKLHAPVKLVEHVKKESSKYVKTLGPQYAGFYWQRGYGLFSVGPTRLAAVEDYVRQQVEHHRTRTFQEEYLAFLKRYAIEYDERYVWD